jgi:hypothetical protein
VKVLRLHLLFLLFIIVLILIEVWNIGRMMQRNTSVFREKCDRARLSRSPSEICGRHGGAGTDFHQYYSTNAADQCSSISGLSKTGCRLNPKYSLTSWVT